MSDLDDQIRSSLERLTNPDGIDRGQVWDSVVARRRRRSRRRAVGVAVPAAALAVVVATVVPDLWSDPSETVIATNPDDGGVEDSPTGKSLVPTDVPTYTLDLAGAELLREESLMARNSDVVLWGDGEGAYVSLSVRPGVSATYGAPSGLGPMVRDSALPEDAGAAWLSEPEDPRGATMWWVQPSGDVWILRAHWYGDIVPDSAEAALREWGLAIDPASAADDPYRLGDERLSRIGFDAAGDKPSRSRVWSYDGQEVTLLVLDGSSSAAGLSNLLARGAPTRTEVPNLGQVWAVGSTFGWTVPESDGAWATLLLPEDLAGESDAILRALAAE
ncbi:MAG: hypothetical protein WD232_05805 [Acidimicrobiales bacterium]